jgi:hypothetical protein
MPAISTKNSYVNLAKIMLFSLASLGLVMFAHQLYAADQNPYEKNYKKQNANDLRSLQAKPDTKIFVGNHKDEDNITMLEDGYDLMGTSGFSAMEASSDFALQHAKSIKADIVMVYQKYESAKTASSKLQLIKEAANKGGEIDPNDLEDEPTQYLYHASYWAKLPMPLFGVHIIKLKQSEADEGAPKALPGLRVIAVIKTSPASNMGLMRGDSLLKLGDVTLNTADDLFTAVKRYAGQKVPVAFQRGDVSMRQLVQLNVRK